MNNNNEPNEPIEEAAAIAQRRALLRGMGAAPLLVLLAGCGDGDEASSGSTPIPPASTGFQPRNVRHPGLLHTEADFDRMRSKLSAAAQPWADGWSQLLNSGRSHLGATPRPLETVIRGGTGQNFAQMYTDMARAHQLAVRWKVTGDAAYAERAVLFLNAWSSTMTTLTGNADRFLAAGLYGYQWANAAEIMRTYPGWAAADVQRFRALLLNVFYPLCHSFLTEHNGTEHTKITNYWANWDLCALCGIFAIGVFCDRTDLMAEAVSYYKTGRGNGAAAHNVYCIHPGHLGQWQESSRDQGHATLGIALAGALCEMAWNQGEDLYGHWNNRLLSGAEYVAQSNLTDANGAFYELPFSTYANVHGVGTGVSPAGRPHTRPCWELVYNHYVNRRGLSAPWVSAMVEKVRPEAYDGSGDQPGLGSLLYARDAGTVSAPVGLSARLVGGQVQLSWWGSADATRYRIKRAVSASGPFAAIGEAMDPRTFTDSPADGTWYYTISAMTPSGERNSAEVLRVAVPGELLVHLPLASDTQDRGGSGRHGSLVGGASWGLGRGASQALQLDGVNGHLALPSGVASELADFTIAVWVHWNAASTHARVFDFGTGDVAYMALTPRDGNGRLKFMITGTTGIGEQSVTANALPTGRWVHVAVTLSGRVGTLYVDGAAAGSSSQIELAPWQLGATPRNWLGRSQYAADPYFNGRLQDLRIYRGALSETQVAALVAATPA
jgi:hypothetical protein